MFFLLNLDLKIINHLKVIFNFESVATKTKCEQR